MTVETTYTQLRDKLATFLDPVVEDREVVIVQRRGAKMLRCSRPPNCPA